MNGVYIMLLFFNPMAAAGVEKVGIYGTHQECVKAAEDAGFLPISESKDGVYRYTCVFSQSDYGYE